jgi:hypothetical protein
MAHTSTIALRGFFIFPVIPFLDKTGTCSASHVDHFFAFRRVAVPSYEYAGFGVGRVGASLPKRTQRRHCECIQVERTCGSLRFRSSSTQAPPTRKRSRRTVIVPAARSKSPQRSPTVSACRAPVVAASTTRAMRVVGHGGEEVSQVLDRQSAMLRSAARRSLMARQVSDGLGFHCAGRHRRRKKRRQRAGRSRHRRVADACAAEFGYPPRDVGQLNFTRSTGISSFNAVLGRGRHRGGAGQRDDSKRDNRRHRDHDVESNRSGRILSVFALGFLESGMGGVRRASRQSRNDVLHDFDDERYVYGFLRVPRRPAESALNPHYSEGAYMGLGRPNNDSHAEPAS